MIYLPETHNSLQDHTKNSFEDLITQNMRANRTTLHASADEINRINMQNLGREKLQQFDLPHSYNALMPALSFKVGTYMHKGQALETAMHNFMNAMEQQHTPARLTELGTKTIVANNEAEDAALTAKDSLDGLVLRAQSDSEVDLFTHSDISSFRDEVSKKHELYVNNIDRIHNLARVAGIEL